MRVLRSAGYELAFVAAMLTTLGACAVGPDFVRPTPLGSDRYTVEPMPPATVAADDKSQRFTSGAMLDADWWRLFKSAQLDAVVQQALATIRPAGIRGKPASESA